MTTEQLARQALRRAADCLLLPDGKLAGQMRTWQWGQGVALFSLGQAYDVLGDERYLDYIENWLDAHLAGGEIGRSINTTAPLLGAVKLTRERKADKYIPLCRAFADWCMNEAPRSAEDAFEHSCTENKYPNEIWADTLFMGCLFLAEWGSLVGDASFLKEAARQFALHYKYLHDPETGLIYHGYSGNDGMRTGVLWGRGNGWFAAASAEMLRLLSGMPEREPVADTFLRHLRGVAATQDNSGGWHTVMNDRSTSLEMSCTAAFAYALNHACEAGIAPDGSRARAEQAAQAVIAHLDERGYLTHGSGGTCVMPSSADYDAIPYAFSPFTQGLGLLALASEARAEAVRS